MRCDCVSHQRMPPTRRDCVSRPELASSESELHLPSEVGLMRARTAPHVGGWPRASLFPPIGLRVCPRLMGRSGADTCLGKRYAQGLHQRVWTPMGGFQTPMYAIPSPSRSRTSKYTNRTLRVGIRTPPYGIRVTNKGSRCSREEHAPMPYSGPMQGPGDVTWPLGAWCKPSHGSKASVCIKCKTTKTCSDQAQGIVRLVTGLCNHPWVIKGKSTHPPRGSSNSGLS
jgi:hypothetical protein